MGLLALVVMLCPQASRADVASDQAGAILVFPKIVVDTADPPATLRGRVDTLIRISNTSDQPITLKCFYVNANGHCSNSPTTICTPGLIGASSPCGSSGICLPGWQEADFRVNLTALQPVGWLASEGAVACEEVFGTGLPCFPLGGAGPELPNTNGGSRVPPVSEDPFVGELRCIAVDRNDVPVERNDLKGEAELVRVGAEVVDVLAYNAVGIPALPRTNNRDNVLVLGGESPEYSSCPNVLILDHFFDGAEDPVSGNQVVTDLTLVPCTQNYLTQQPVTTPVQFLVFNEFEQRFSTSRRVTCFQEFRLSTIDTASPDRSIFSAAVAGTLTGQTRIRGVANNDKTQGHALLGLAEEFRVGGGGAAFNLHFSGTRQQSDFIYLP
jgi:hypothetical protein